MTDNLEKSFRILNLNKFKMDKNEFKITIKNKIGIILFTVCNCLRLFMTLAFEVMITSWKGHYTPEITSKI